MCEVSCAVEFIVRYLKDIKIERIELTGRRGRRLKQLLNDLKGRRGYWKFIVRYLRDIKIERIELTGRRGRSLKLNSWSRFSLVLGN